MLEYVIGEVTSTPPVVAFVRRNYDNSTNELDSAHIEQYKAFNIICGERT